MAGPLRSYDTPQLCEKLKRLAEHPEHLDRARERFHQSPGPSRSGTTTRGPSRSPTPPEERRRITEITRRMELKDSRLRALPD